MMSYGYTPAWSEGAIKPPIFQTSTFVFKNAEEGKAFFELAYGLRQQGPDEEMGLIYSRLNNPSLEILEHRLCLWDGAEEAASFASGMAAISTTLLALLQPGDVVLHSEPVYGGSDFFLKNVLRKFGIKAVGFRPTATPAANGRPGRRHRARPPGHDVCGNARQPHQPPRRPRSLRRPGPPVFGTARKARAPGGRQHLSGARYSSTRSSTGPMWCCTRPPSSWAGTPT